MYEMFQMSPQDTRSLLAIIRSGGVFNAARAVYWPCTTGLLGSEIYRKIENAVEEKLGKRVYFIFDELFTPHPGPDGNFEVWHKDIEDENFEGGCWNVWIPLYSSGETVSQLELVVDEPLSQFHHVVQAGEPWLSPTVVKEDEFLFVNRNGVMDEQLLSYSDLKKKIVTTSTVKNTVHLFNSGQFHRGMPSRDFNIRLGIKFSTVPYSRTRNIALDIMTFGYWHHTLEREMPSFARLEPREKHYAVARAIHQRASCKLNESSAKDAVLYEALLDSLLRQ